MQMSKPILWRNGSCRVIYNAMKTSFVTGVAQRASCVGWCPTARYNYESKLKLVWIFYQVKWFVPKVCLISHLSHPKVCWYPSYRTPKCTDTRKKSTGDFKGNHRRSCDNIYMLHPDFQPGACADPEEGLVCHKISCSSILQACCILRYPGACADPVGVWPLW